MKTSLSIFASITLIAATVLPVEIFLDKLKLLNKSKKERKWENRQIH